MEVSSPGTCLKWNKNCRLRVSPTGAFSVTQRAAAVHCEMGKAFFKKDQLHNAVDFGLPILIQPLIFFPCGRSDNSVSFSGRLLY